MIAPGEAGIRQAAKAGWRSLSTAAVPAIWGAAYKSLTERPTGPPLSVVAAGRQEPDRSRSREPLAPRRDRPACAARRSGGPYPGQP
jgi:hypothetical protein